MCCVIFKNRISKYQKTKEKKFTRKQQHKRHKKVAKSKKGKIILQLSNEVDELSKRVRLDQQYPRDSLDSIKPKSKDQKKKEQDKSKNAQSLKKEIKKPELKDGKKQDESIVTVPKKEVESKQNAIRELDDEVQHLQQDIEQEQKAALGDDEVR